jgi:hypothetical protein
MIGVHFISVEEEKASSNAALPMMDQHLRIPTPQLI